jgi:2-polyprenyl-3-methyl-5-hydroxy-6-metoxy-1,4-benzoquinol methylase
MKRSDTFWDSAADKYARKPIGNEAAYAQTLERTRTYLSTDLRCLEIGCGTGTTALKLASSVGQLTATDISGRMIEIAKEKAKDPAIGNVTFAKQTLNDIADGAERYDVVLGFNILHLFDQPDMAIATLHKVLKPGGMFITKTPCLGQKLAYLKPLVWIMQKLGKAPRVHFLKYTQLEDMIRTAGFELLETGLYPASTGSRFIVAKRV